VSLAAGEKRSLTFAVTPETLALHDEGGNLISFPGFYEVVVSNGVRERVTYAVHVVGEERVVRPFMSTSSAVSGVDTADKNPAVAMALSTAFAENKVLEAAME